MAKDKPYLWELTLEDLAEKPDSPNNTEPTRLSKLDYYMTFWIGKATTKKSAQVLKPIVRKRLLELFAKHRETIEKLQKNMREAAAIVGDAAEDEEEAEEAKPQPKPRKGKA